MAEAPDPIATGYDAFYAAWDRSPTLARIWKTHVTGDDFPTPFRHISFVNLANLRRLASALDLTPGTLLADIGCGAGGPGSWVAHESGARLIGRDLSTVAVAKAAARVADVGIADRAEFAVGTFERTGLPSNSVDAAMTVDALQYAPEKSAAFAEFARVIRPGGRLGVIAFELDDRAANFGWSDPVGDYRPLLEAAGFDTESYEQLDRWDEVVRATYIAVRDARVALEDELGVDAASALALEASLTLELEPYCGHVLAIARRR